MATRRETSAETAARFLASRERLATLYKRPRPYRRRRALEQVLGVRTAAMLHATPNVPRRIACDFAEPTLRLIHDVLLDAMHANVEFGDRGALLMIAERMVAAALGMPPCDDPPLTDREAG